MRWISPFWPFGSVQKQTTHKFALWPLELFPAQDSLVTLHTKTRVKSRPDANGGWDWPSAAFIGLGWNGCQWSVLYKFGAVAEGTPSDDWR
jgi:hypothetical protein